MSDPKTADRDKVSWPVWPPRFDVWVAALLTILFAVGTAGHLYSPTFGLMMTLTPFFLFFSNTVVAWGEGRFEGRRFLLWLFPVYAVTFALEALGTATGWVFGAYRYGEVLGWAWLDTPFVIGLNWTLVVWGAWTLARRLPGGQSWAGPVYTAVLATAFDWVMEPAAIHLGYWTWTAGAGEIPLQNYLAWFVISLGAASLAKILRLDGQKLLPAVYFGLQVLFFAVLRFGFGLA